MTRVSRRAWCACFVLLASFAAGCSTREESLRLPSEQRSEDGAAPNLSTEAKAEAGAAEQEPSEQNDWTLPAPSTGANRIEPGANRSEPAAPSPTAPLTTIPGLEELSFEEVQRWWPHGALQAGQLPQRGGRERWFAVQDEEGARCDPAMRGCTLAVLYEPASVSADSSSLDRLYADGAILVTASVASTAPTPLPGAHPVEVRGGPGFAVQLEQRRNGVDRRKVSWGPRASEPSVTWEATAHPDRLTERRLLDFLDAMIKVRAR